MLRKLTKMRVWVHEDYYDPDFLKTKCGACFSGFRAQTAETAVFGKHLASYGEP